MEVSIWELRNKGGELVDRVARGESLTVTRSGRPVAELRPPGRELLAIEELIARRRRLPGLDLAVFREDLDRILYPSP